MRLRDKIQLKNIPVARIKTDTAPLNKSLQLSMLEAEQKDPIKVRVIHGNPDYDYQIVNGRRRLRAALESEQAMILAYVVTEMDDTELALQALIGNSGTPNEYDEARHILALEEAGYSGLEIAKMTGYSSSTITQRKKLIEKLHPLGQLKLQNGEIKVSTALAATKLPLDEQAELFSNGKNPSYKDVFEKVRAWESDQLAFDIEVQTETKPGLFLTAEQVETLLAQKYISVEWMGKSFNIKAQDDFWVEQ